MSRQPEDDSPSYLNSSLIITEVDRQADYIEVTYFGIDSGVLEADTTITNILRSIILAAR